MPFFGERLSKVYQIRILNVTLQVRIPYKQIPVKNIILDASFFRKRVLSFASLPARRRKKASGAAVASLTVEAALGLSLFLFASVCLMMPMRMLDTQRKIQTALEIAAEDISRLAYIKTHRSESENTLKNQEAWESDYSTYFSGLAVEGYLKYKILEGIGDGKIEAISFHKSSILEDGEHVDIVMDYRMKLPFSIFQIDSLPMTSRSIKRAWIGRDGKSGGGEEGQQEKGVTVYIGRNKTRYHWFRDCHYLYNHILTVPFSEVSGHRNQNGGRYKPCNTCGAGATVGTNVYIMPSGDKYHSNQYCSAIIAYVKAVPLSTVQYLGACSYCESKKGGES